ncbi:MAG: hypothetical protein WD078_09935 [Woeseia sp.]
MNRRTRNGYSLAVLALALAACGGGGGGGGGGDPGGNPPPPPPPPASETYTLELSGLGLRDRQTASAVTPTGLPVSGAVATHDP